VIKRLNSQNQACPDQKFALVGYSQGAMVMHIALSSNYTTNAVSPAALKKIVGGAMFGDPFMTGGKPMMGLPQIKGMPTNLPAFPSALNEKIKEQCAASFGSTDPVS
jgi:cutinase